MKKIVFAIGLLASIFFGQNTYAQCNDTLKWKTHDIYYLHFINKITGKYKMGSLTDATINTKEMPNFVTAGVLVSTVDNSARSIYFEYKISDKQGNIVFTSLDTVAVKSLKAYDSMAVAQAKNRTEIDISKWDTGTYIVKLWVKSTSLDEEFCDSIKELGSYTANFRIVHGNTSIKQTATASLKLFPNPARERISVECGTEMRRVTLCNALGQQVLRVSPNAPQAELQVAGLPRGLYLLKVETAVGSAVRKVVVE